MAGSETVPGRAPPGRVGGRVGAPRVAQSLRRIVFVCYGPFDSNSGVHMAGFANSLAAKGYSVAACAAGGNVDGYDFGRPSFESFDIEELRNQPERVFGAGSETRPEQIAIVCWTPREIVRRAIQPVAQRLGISYFVHLEDNEEHLARLRLASMKRRPWRRETVPETISDPAGLPAFLGGARGITLIEERLRETAPAHVPALLLEPGVDLHLFGGDLAPARRTEIRRPFGCSETTTLIVYPGNAHRANAEEVRTLYDAVRLLRGRGRDVTLVRTGTDTGSAAAILKKAAPEHGIVALGRVDRTLLVDLLKSADLFVQPGRPGPFNDYRLPSKLPEFMAVGRPIVLPATNVGTRLRHGVDAMLLRDGSREEIARLIEEILSDPTLAARLSANARAFAMSHYDPMEQTRKLEDFLQRVA
jgi:glycosyltransferase involved in cell wall biosynthesis